MRGKKEQRKRNFEWLLERDSGQLLRRNGMVSFTEISDIPHFITVGESSAFGQNGFSKA
jgi:hypothetical protein